MSEGPAARAPAGASGARPGTAALAASCRQIDRIDVWKRDHLLRAHCASGEVISMEVALGRNRAEDKLRMGDLRTPEGIYRVSEPPRDSDRFHRFVPLDYPSREDARRGHAAGRLSRADLDRILSAHDEGRPPPQDTPLGGDIGLHGEGERWQGASARLDWTFGCIAVSDAEIEFLADRLEPGVEVVIHP